MATRRRICRIRVLAKMAISAILAGLDTFARHLPTLFPGLDTLDRHSPTLFPGLARLAKGKFGDFYMNLANLASLVNLASVD